MRKLLAVVVVVGLLFGGFLVAVPAEWSVRSQVVTHAAPQQLHALVGTPEKYREWVEGGYLKQLDSFDTSGSAGVGGSASWKSGGWSHRITITKSDPERGVWFDEALGQTTDNGKGSITFSPVKGGTRVTWESRGKRTFAQRLSSPFLGFELTAYATRTLKHLASVAEAGE